MLNYKDLETGFQNEGCGLFIIKRHLREGVMDALACHLNSKTLVVYMPCTS